MKLRVKEVVLTQRITEIDVEFPYIAWSNNNKHEIIKISPDFNDDNEFVGVGLIILTDDLKGVQYFIETDNIVKESDSDAFNDELTELIRRYSIPATNEEYVTLSAKILKHVGGVTDLKVFDEWLEYLNRLSRKILGANI